MTTTQLHIKNNFLSRSKKKPKPKYKKDVKSKVSSNKKFKV